MDDEHVIQAATPGNCCIALISTDNGSIAVISSYYSRKYHVPVEIMSMIIIFAKSTKVVSTDKGAGSGHGKDDSDSESMDKPDFDGDKTDEAETESL